MRWGFSATTLRQVGRSGRGDGWMVPSFIGPAVVVSASEYDGDALPISMGQFPRIGKLGRMRVGGARHEGCCVVRLARWPQDRDGDHG